MRRALAALAVAATAAALSPPGGAAAAACTTLQYISGLQAAARVLAGPRPDVAEAVSELEGLQARYAPEPGILTPVVDDLRAAPPQVGDAQQRLDVLAAALAVAPGSTCHIDPSGARSALHDVYASPVFANLDQNVQPSLLGRILAFLASLIDHLTGALGVPGSILLAIAVLGSALALAWWRLRGVLGSRAAAIALEPASPGDDPDAEWSAARAAAARGEHREAVRRAFRGALLDVAVRGGGRFENAWTTRELLRSLEADPDMLAALAPAAAAFDHAWYSGEPVDAVMWEQARSRCEAVRALARRRRPVAP